MMDNSIREIRAALESGKLIPYLGAELLAAPLPPPPACGKEDGGAFPRERGKDGTGGSAAEIPITPAGLAARLSAKATVPFKVRANMTAAAQYIENFKHRKTLVAFMKEIFSAPAAPSPAHRFFAAQAQLPLLVDTWYDAAAREAYAGRSDWGQVQGVSRAEHRDTWVKYYRADGGECGADEADGWRTLIYKPLGSVAPAANFIVSDSDFVEVLTEIDIQTPIPPRVQELRNGRRFLFLGCRFRNQLERSFARQVMKRSDAGPHWALLEGELSKNELRFLAEQNIARLDMTPAALLAALGQDMPLAA